MLPLFSGKGKTENNWNSKLRGMIWGKKKQTKNPCQYPVSIEHKYKLIIVCYILIGINYRVETMGRWTCSICSQVGMGIRKSTDQFFAHGIQNFELEK